MSKYKKKSTQDSGSSRQLVALHLQAILYYVIKPHQKAFPIIYVHMPSLLCLKFLDKHCTACHKSQVVYVRLNFLIACFE